ncbi:DUF3080 family protein [Gallaecimonas sp. GXIMD4217]|uniref:DUF3080 family protein n=1 Tax=Gallaecimonas sp. GXIMD4217 TaxID=3131927 RepID=UPI00311B3774
MRWPWLLAGLLLCGCERSGGPLVDYPQRLANVLDVPHEPSPLPVLAAGGGRPWAAPQAEITIGLTELYALRKCNLGALIGARNSALGKVAPPSQRFLYEVELLHGLNHCDQAPAKTRQLAERLAAQKAPALPLAAWHLVSQDDAFRRNWRHGVAPLAVGDFPGLYDAITAVTDIRALLQGWDPIRAARLESGLAALAHGRILARLNVSLYQARHQLDAAAELLEQHQQHIPCPNGRPGARANTIGQFFFGYYGNKVQPHLGELLQANRLLKRPLSELIVSLPVPTSAREQVRYLSGLDEGSLSADFDAALKRHTQAWQQFLGRCGLRPGG